VRIAAGLLALVVVAATNGAASATPAAMVVRTSVAPSRVSFGDVVVARVVVELGGSSAGSLDLAPSFGPYVELGPPGIERDGASLTYRYRLQCLTDGCLPGKAPAVVRFQRVTVTGRSGERTVTASASWPALTVVSRVAAGDLSRAAPRFRRPATVPPASYLVPGILTVLLAVAAALLGVASAVLLGLEGLAYRRRRKRAALDRRTPLERAIALARQAAERPDPADRRKALNRLAEALERAGAAGLAATAGRAAWAEMPPTASVALELAERAEPHLELEPA
jgi:hypothetical protein